MNYTIYQNSGDELTGAFLFYSNFFDESNCSNIQNKIELLGTRFIKNFLTSGMYYGLVSNDLDTEKALSSIVARLNQSENIHSHIVLIFSLNNELKKDSIDVYLDPNTYFEPIKNMIETCFFNFNGISTEIKKSKCTHLKNIVCLKIELSKQTLNAVHTEQSQETKIQNSVRMFCFNLKGFLKASLE